MNPDGMNPGGTVVDSTSIGHRLRAMTGRDPHQEGRVATSLELFYDLVFVVAVAAATRIFRWEPRR